jgi:hypothetical protein
MLPEPSITNTIEGIFFEVWTTALAHTLGIVSTSEEPPPGGISVLGPVPVLNGFVPSVPVVPDPLPTGANEPALEERLP